MNKTASAKARTKRQGNALPFQKCAINAKRRRQQAKQDISLLCGMGMMWCHTILCMHVLESRRC